MIITIVLVSSWNPANKSNFYLIFLFTVLTSVVFFLPTDTWGTAITSLLFPWALPFFYLIGPSFLVLSLESKVSRPLALFLLLPFATLCSVLFLQIIFNNELYNTQVALGISNNFSKSSTFLIADKDLLLFYPVHVFVFAVLALIALVRQRSKKILLLLPSATILFMPLVLDLVYSFIHGGDYMIISDNNLLRNIYLVLVLVVIMDALLVKSRKKKNQTNSGSLEDPVSVSSLTPEQVDFFISSEIKNAEALIFDNYVTPHEFYKGTPFSQLEWSAYFKESDTSYAWLKKTMRIQRSILLMKNGYLEENSIDALSNDVGYASRTSLYKVFLEIEGCSLPAFRKSLSLDSD